MPLQINEITEVNNHLSATVIDTTFKNVRPKQCPAVLYDHNIYLADKTYGLCIAPEESKEIRTSLAGLKGFDLALNENFLYLLGRNEIAIIDLTPSPKLKVNHVAKFQGTGLNMVLDGMFLYVLCWPFYLHIFDVSYENQLKFISTVEAPKGYEIVFDALHYYHQKRFVIRTNDKERPIIIRLKPGDNHSCKIGNANDLVRAMA